MADWVPSADDSPLSADLIPSRDYRGLNMQDTQLRVWLPDGAKQALTEIGDRVGASYTVYLSEFFATYLYGYHELLKMRDTRTGLYEPVSAEVEESEEEEAPPPEDELGPEYDDPEPEMGKNIFALKIFMSNKMKDGLQQRANRAQVPLGRFARALICAHLFGRDVGPRRLLGWSRSNE
ncbi:hypothetical protein [Azoarcus sp. KH32C]|uniref:hypothetical protein n=1 Tax=Azoarcus sp. KH32C TaxID=748247 RepID=UPI0005A146A1|nr:hypothetical protein [Azoarcus sp. KH32C]